MAYEVQTIGFNDYKAVEYKNSEGDVSYVLLYVETSVGTTDHPEEGTCWRQVPGRFRTIREAFFYASLREEQAELEATLRQKTRRLEYVNGMLKGWNWVA